MSASDRTKSINLELLEEMFQIEEKEKAINPGQFILWCLKMAPFKWEYVKWYVKWWRHAPLSQKF